MSDGRLRFARDHYVPVLKAKRGEKHALESLAPHVITSVTPLLEVVEMKPGDSLDDHLQRSFKGMARAVSRCAPYILDLQEISPAGAPGARRALAAARQLGVPFIPVTGLSRTADVAAALQSATHGIAIRLTRTEFEAGRIPRDLLAFIATHRLSVTETDLIVDLGPLDQMVSAGVEQMIRQFMPRVPDPTQWRNLTLLGCGFPKSMGVAARNSVTLVERPEWIAWKEACFGRRHVLPRLPTFGDGAIQHPSGVEGFDPRIMQVSATVRYALDQEWALIKGVSTDSIPARTQFPQLARQLVSGTASRHFAGGRHCPACSEIVQAAAGNPGYGSAEKWRRLGTTHHITRTVNQLRSLPWP